MGRCKDCRHWQASREEVKNGNECRSPRLLRGYGFTEVPVDGALVEDDCGWGLITGPDFGCVLFEEKT